MSDIYYAPEKFGLTTIGEVDFSDGCYQFDLTVVWRRDSDGVFVYADDSGCSCPSPFEDKGIADLVVLRKRGGLADFRKHLAQREADSYGPSGEDLTAATVNLIERMRAAGAR